MKFIFIILAVIATTYAAFPSSEYLPPLENDFPTNNLDLQTLGESSSLADDGYHYKTVKRLRLRHRRDVGELPLSEYLPPTQSAAPVADLPVIVDVPEEKEQKQNTAVLADDGYHYKTIRRIRYRHRRDVNELPSNDYLPPTQVNQVGPTLTSAPHLTDNGYSYKTVKRLVYKHRI